MCIRQAYAAGALLLVCMAASGANLPPVNPFLAPSSNAFAIGEDGGLYIASRDHMHKVVWTGEELNTDGADGAWSAPYFNGLGEGTGATPSLMGFGGKDRLVVNNTPRNVPWYLPGRAGTLLDEDGREHYGTPRGRVRLNVMQTGSGAGSRP